MNRTQNTWSKIFATLNQPGPIGALGILLVVILIWAPFDLKTTDIMEGWQNLRFTETSLRVIFRINFPRPLLYLPWKIASIINNDSFMGARLLLAALFWGKAFALYALLRKMRFTSAPLAFLIAILFILQPADQGNLMLRALSRHFAVFTYLLAALFMVLACQRSNWLYVLGMLASVTVSVLISEQGFLPMLVTPLILWLCQAASKKKKIIIAALWYLALGAGILNFIRVSFATSSVKASYQQQIFARGSNFSPLLFIKEVVLSNLVAYRRLFIDGWLNTLARLAQEVVAGQFLYISIALLFTLAVGLIVWRLAQAQGQTDYPANTQKHALALFLGGLVLIGAGFFPYSLTVYRYDDVRVFYFAAAGAALSAGIVYFQLGQFFPRFKQTIQIALWGLTVFLMAFSGLRQYANLAAQSQGQQQIILRIIEQAPYVNENTAFVLLTDQVSGEPFEITTTFREALLWSYQMENRNIRPVICYKELDNCTFTPTGLDALVKRFFTTPPARLVTPYDEMLIFEYHGGSDVRLLDQIPLEYQQAGVSYNYRPYQRIASYVPFPRRPQIAFEFTPASARLAPAGWTNTGQTLNDRQACGVSSLGRCSLLFYGDAAATAFTQDLPISGKAGEQFELTLWNKAQDAAGVATPIVAVTVFYSDSSTETFTASSQPSADWTLANLTFQPAKPYTHLRLELLPNLPAGLIWLDDLHLTRAGLEMDVNNPSFEK